MSFWLLGQIECRDRMMKEEWRSWRRSSKEMWWGKTTVETGSWRVLELQLESFCVNSVRWSEDASESSDKTTMRRRSSCLEILKERERNHSELTSIELTSAQKRFSKTESTVFTSIEGRDYETKKAQLFFLTWDDLQGQRQTAINEHVDQSLTSRKRASDLDWL